MSDPTETDEGKLYLVHLPMRLNAASPAEAVDKFIEEINSYGLRAWHYTVVSGDTLTAVTGKGQVINRDDEPEDVTASEQSD